MPIKIKGNDYKTVAERRLEFDEDREEGDSVSIETDIVEMNENIVLMKTTITKQKINQSAPDIFTGYAQAFIEAQNKQSVNYGSYIENCETSAIGRALASAGYSGSHWASAEEMQRIGEKTDAKATQREEVESLKGILRETVKEKGITNNEVQTYARDTHGATIASLDSEKLNAVIDWVKSKKEKK